MGRTFNGTSDHLAFGSDAACDQLAQWTAMALIRPTATVSGEKQVLTKMNSSFAGKIFLGLEATDKIFSFMNRSSVNCITNTANGVLVTNSWNVIIATWPGSGSAITIEWCLLGGILADVSSGPTAGSGTFTDDSSATLRFATRDPLDATFYGGGAADFGLWNRVLSAVEKGDLGLGRAPELIPSGLVAGSRITGSARPEINTAGGTNGTVTGTSLLTHPATIYSVASSVQLQRTARGMMRGVR